jgi:hypothetical protein
VAISELPLRVPEKYAELRPVFDLLRRAILARIESMAFAGDTNATELLFAAPVGGLNAAPAKSDKEWRFVHGGP